jgi:hypothetical protein
MTGANAMETSTIRIAIRGLNEPWDASRIPAVLDGIEASLREEAAGFTFQVRHRGWRQMPRLGCGSRGTSEAWR